MNSHAIPVGDRSEEGGTSDERYATGMESKQLLDHLHRSFVTPFHIRSVGAERSEVTRNGGYKVDTVGSRLVM